MKDIENVEDRKMSEEEVARKFQEVYSYMEQDEYINITLTDAFLFMYDEPFNSMIKKWNMEKICKKFVLEYLMPLTSTNFLDYFIITYEIIINRIIEIQYMLLREKYVISEDILIYSDGNCESHRKRYDNEFKKIEDGVYSHFIKDYEEAYSICKRELAFILKQCKKYCFDFVENKPEFEAVLECLNDASIESAFMRANSRERLNKKVAILGTLFEEKVSKTKNVGKAQTFISRYNISFPKLYVWAGYISQIYGGENTVDDLVDSTKLISQKLKIYRVFCTLPLYYRDEYDNHEDEYRGCAAWPCPSFMRAEYIDTTMDNNYEIRDENEPIPLEILTNFPQDKIIIKTDFDMIEQCCKLAAPKLPLLIDKYKEEKGIEQNVDIYKPVFINKSAFYRIYNGESKPNKNNLIRLILGLRLVGDEIKNFINATKYSNEVEEYYKIIKYAQKIFKKKYSKQKSVCDDIKKDIEIVVSASDVKELKEILK